MTSFAHFDTSRTDGVYVSFTRVDEHDNASDPSDYLFQDPEYQAEDEARLAAWRRDDWHFLGIRARADVAVIRNRVATLYSLTSAGTWGVESDSDDTYLAELFAEQCAELKSDIAAFASLPISFDDTDPLPPAPTAAMVPQPQQQQQTNATPASDLSDMPLGELQAHLKTLEHCTGYRRGEAWASIYALELRAAIKAREAAMVPQPRQQQQANAGRTVTATYDMSEDAMGLGPFIDAQFAANQDAVVVYVSDQHGNPVSKVSWVETELTDGSITYDLVVHVDAPVMVPQPRQQQQACAPHDRPMAAAGLTSYRCRNRYGWTMIGARDHADAMREARRSSSSAHESDLQIWNGTQYVPVLPHA